VERELLRRQIELPAAAIEPSARSERLIRRGNYAAVILLGILVAWASVNFYRSSQQEKIESLALAADSIRAIGSNHLCPGDVLTTQFEVDIEGVGVVTLDDTIVHPAGGYQIVKYSEPQQNIISRSGRWTFSSVWTVPSRPAVPVDGVYTWKPGEYDMILSLSASNSYISRYTEPVTLTRRFFINADCEVAK
jgi:uncharacterized Zn-binding protein involved in type VI secretion